MALFQMECAYAIPAITRDALDPIIYFWVRRQTICQIVEGKDEQ